MTHNNQSVKTNNKDSCVETTSAPEWLNKLESRREKLSKGKLGHESGAGAPCNYCGDACPGLDLHFWRKECRNCRCRKDQHKVPDDDDLTGWAQFEILGQIRSKPAYMKIKALADQPVQLEWIPPNVAPDLVSDYMDQLGSSKIPVAGSDAATKRKEQLEFQVPPHDLDATLCDNLSENEAQQLQMYVQKIRDNCVGQGSVIRVGQVQHGKLISLPTICKAFNESPGKIINDRIAHQMVSSEALTGALMSDKIFPLKQSFTPFAKSVVLPVIPHNTVFQDKVKNFDIPEIQNLLENGQFYDKVLNHLSIKNLDVTKDPLLGPIRDFREECRLNPQFQEAMESFIAYSPQYSSPLKTVGSAPQFFSPIQPRIPSKFPTAMRQETPMRKVKFGGLNYDIGISPTQVEKDPIFYKILSSEKLNSNNNNIILSHLPMTVASSYQSCPPLSPATFSKLKKMGLSKQALLSGFVNGQFYDKLFENLRGKGVNYADCKLLRPLEMLRTELLGDSDPEFKKEITEFVESLPESSELSFNTNPFKMPGALQGIHGSKSTDSGFESKPGTPSKPSTPSGLNAFAGQFASIPGIEEMNMYPSVHPSTATSSIFGDLPNSVENMTISGAENNTPSLIMNCKECSEPIISGEVAVKADRAGKEDIWHPQCFKCTMCQELLADLVYFYHGGNIYCGRDLAITLKIPRCKACDELIFTKEYTAAENSTFHIKHFCCYRCDTPLAGQQYIPDDKTNMPLCLACYDHFYAEKCKRCNNVIGPTEQGVSWGKIHWHGECFLCAGLNCGKSLIGGRFCVKNEMPFCSPACVQSVL